MNPSAGMSLVLGKGTPQLLDGGVGVWGPHSIKGVEIHVTSLGASRMT